MSEPPLPTALPPPGGPLPASCEAQAGARRGSYWWIVWGQFRRRREAVIGLLAVLALFVVAWFAPLIASDRPLYMRTAGGADSPALRSLFTERYYVDRFFNGAILVLPLVAVWALVRRARRPRAERPDWLDTIVGAAPVMFAAWAVAGVVMMFGTRFVNEPRRYPELDARARGGDEIYVFAPVPFGAHYQDRTVMAPAGYSRRHRLGTDDTGRDVLALLIHGTRLALSVGIVAVGIATAIGVVLGSLMGYFGGWVDVALSRFVEVMICFPTLFLVIMLVVAFGQSIFLIMLAIGLTGWTGVARLVRGEFLKLKNQDFVTAAHALGAGGARVMFRHMLPNALGPVLVSVTFGVAGAILTESGLSFLGLGDVNLPSWGKVLNGGLQHLGRAPWLVIFPGIEIFGTVLMLNLAGEGLRDAMDPRLRG